MTSTTATAAPESTVARPVLVFCTVAAALFMGAVDSTIVATALHSLQRGLDTSITWAGWTLTAYSFGIMVMLPVSGKLSQYFGHRRVFLASVVIFTIASVSCGLTGNIYVLIVLRIVQAAGGAGFTPSGTAIIVEHFGKARDRAVSLFGVMFPIGALIGPVFGGAFVSWWGWRSVFFINAPVGMAIALLAWRFVPRDTGRANRPAFTVDTPGMALMGVALLAGMLAIKALGDRGVPLASPQFLLPAAAALLAGCGFFHHAGHARRPFVAPRFMYGKGFGAVNVINAVYGGVVTGAVVLLPLYATNRYGLGVFAAGTLLAAQGVAGITMSVLGTLALRRTGYHLPLYAGTVAISLGTALVALQPPAAIGPHLWLMGSAFLIGLGTGTVSPSSRNAGLQLAPDQSSMLAALRTLCFQIGTILAVAIATAALGVSPSPGTTQGWIYAAMALLFALTIPLIARVPESHGAW